MVILRDLSERSHGACIIFFEMRLICRGCVLVILMKSYSITQFGGNDNDREEWMVDGFREVIQYCGFTDLGYSGTPYTWDNRRENGHNIKVRLDWALVDDNMLDLFSDSVVVHVQTAESDHCAIKIELKQFGMIQNQGRARPFRYENMWRRHPSYEDVVASSWGDGCRSLMDVNANLGSMQRVLRQWDKNKFGSVRNELKLLRSCLEVLRGLSLRRGPTKEERDTARRVTELLAREESMEKQRSRVDWLREGDRNTGYFQAKAKQHTRRNKITSLKHADGPLCLQQHDFEAMAVEFYHQLFTVQGNTSPDEVVRFVPHKVTKDMNNCLCVPFTTTEVEKALFAMKPNKSPDPDGFTAGFYQRQWPLVNEDICYAVLDFLNGGDMPEVVNNTILILIPKVKNPQDLTQFRPIALCNVLYKICSKVITNRLLGFLDDIISEEQSAFVPGRLITDNVLIAYESIHYLKNKRGKTSVCAVKLDMAKAYDRVEWIYL
jgi:hypothetical protein